MITDRVFLKEVFTFLYSKQMLSTSNGTKLHPLTAFMVSGTRSHCGSSAIAKGIILQAKQSVVPVGGEEGPERHDDHRCYLPGYKERKVDLNNL
jgi:hypothetical protein